MGSSPTTRDEYWCEGGGRQRRPIPVPGD